MASATWTQSRSKKCWDFTEPTVTYVDNGNGTAKVTIKIYARRIDSDEPFYGRTTTVSSNTLTQNSFTAYDLSHNIVTSSEWSKNKAIAHVATLVVTGTPNSSGTISCTIKIYGVAVSYGHGNRDCTMTISALNGITVTSKYTLTYTANGGTGSNVTQSVNAGSSATLKASNTFTPATTATWGITLNKDGGTGGDATFVNNAFYKWLIGSSYYDAGGSYKPTGNTTVKAYWSTNYKLGTPTKAQTSANGYTVTFDPKGGSCSTTSLTQKNITRYSFGGWKSDSSGTVYNGGTTIGGPAKYAYTAQWTPTTTKGSIKMPSATKSSSSKKTITLNYNGATGGNSTTSLSYTKTTAYAFKGWSANSSATSGSAAGSSFTPTSSGTVYAIWGSATNTYTSVTLPTPTKTGYIFKGWATSSTATSGSTGTYTPTSDITKLYAIWENNTFTLTLNKGTGISKVTGAGSKTGGASVTIGATVSAGYTWKNWTSGTSTTQVSDKQSYTFNMPKANTTYKANATANKYTVTFNANGGNTPSPATKSVTYASTYGDLATCTRTGYDFAGWYTAASGGTQITSTTTVSITSAQTLYAHWTVKSYTLTLNKGTGINTVSGAGNKNYGSTVTISATVLPGYTWKNWTIGTSTAIFTTDQTYSFTMPASARTYKANATANTYYVKYNANGGSGSMSNSTHTYNTKSNLRPNAFTRPGYKFIGWSTSSTATSATYTDQQGVKTLTTTSKGTVNLYAIWQPTSEMYIAVKQTDGTLKFQRALKYVYKTS